MGISHYAVFGIGYKVKSPDEDDILEYFEELFDETEFKCSSAGNYMCQGAEEMEHFVFIKDLDILDPEDILAKKVRLEVLLKDNGLEVEGKFGLIGGAQVM